MKIQRMLLHVTLALLLTAATPPPKIDAFIDSLKKSMTAENASSLTAGRIDQIIASLRQSIASRNFDSAEQLLVNIQERLTTPASIEAIDNLSAAIRARRAAAESEIAETIKAVMEDARSKISAHAKIKDFDPLIERLSHVVPQRSNGGGYSESSTASTVQALRQFIARWQDYLVQTDAGNVEAAHNALTELVSLVAIVPVVPRSELLTIQSEVTARVNATRDARLAGPRAQFEQVLKATRETLDRATSAADIDTLLVDLSKVRPASDSNYGGTYGSGWSELNNRIETTRRFLLRWQDYLSQLANGNGTAAKNTLTQLANDNSADFVYPRSKILDRLNNRKAAESIANAGPTITISDKDFTLENLDAFAEKLSSERWVLDGMEDLLPRLNQLRLAYAQIQLGNQQSAIYLNNSGGLRVGLYGPALARLSEQVLVRSVQLQIRPPDRIHPEERESVVQYIQRVIKAGSEAHDWQLVYRALQSQQATAGGLGNSELGADLAGFRSFFAGLNFETAGQYTPAVRSYLASLRNAGPNLPIDEIGHRLKELKSAHPQEFEIGETTPDPLDAAAFEFGPGAERLRHLRGRAVPSMPAPPASEPAEKVPEISPPKSPAVKAAPKPTSS